MAPELQDRYCNNKADIQSFGCTFLELLTGIRPWQGYDKITDLYWVNEKGVKTNEDVGGSELRMGNKY